MHTTTPNAPARPTDRPAPGTPAASAARDAPSPGSATPPSPGAETAGAARATVQADAARHAAKEALSAGRVHDWNDTRDRYEMIAEAAYFKAEKRGFALGEEELDWLEAEQELIEAMAGNGVAEEA